MRRNLSWAALGLAVLLASACAGTPTDDPDRTVYELYTQAQSSLRNGNYAEAVERFERLVARYPFGVHAVQSQLAIIYTHHLANEHESTIAAADRFIRMHPRNEHVAYALYMRGVSRQAIGPGGFGRLVGVDPNLRDPEPKRRAFADFQELTELYPQSEYIDDARQRMDVIRESLAAHELSVANYYLERKAYIATANRARTVIASYPGTAAVSPAMAVLTRAYRELDLDDLAATVAEAHRQLDEVTPPGELDLAPVERPRPRR